MSTLVGELLPHDALVILHRGERESSAALYTQFPPSAEATDWSEWLRLTAEAEEAGQAVVGNGRGNGGEPGALLAAPILVSGHCVASLIVSRTKGRGFTNPEIAVADHLAAALSPLFRPAGDSVVDASSDHLESAATDDLKREAEISQTVAAIGRVLSSSLNISDVYQAFADQVARMIKFDRITLCHVDARSDTVVRAFVSGAEVPGITQGAAKAYSGSTEQLIIEARRSLIISSDDPAMNRRGIGARNWAKAGFKSLVSAPLFSQGVAVGTIGLSSFRPNAFTQADADLLGRVADQIAGTIANARLHSRMSREAAEREGIARIGHVVGESLDLTSVCDRLAEEVRRLVPYDRLVVTQINEDRGEIFDFYAAGVDVPGRSAYQPYPLPGTLTEAAAQTGQPIRIDVDDVESLIQRYPSMESGVKLGFKSFMAVPLIVESKAIGTINLRSFQASHFTEAHGRLMAEVAAQVAPAIHNAELHHQIQSAAEERLALAEIGRMVGSAHDFSDIYDALVEQIGRLLPADRVSITVPEGSETGRVVFVSGLRPDFRPVDTVFQLDGTVSGWVLHHGRSFISGIGASKTMRRELPRLHEELEAGFRSVLSTPLLEAGEIIGVLHLRTEAPGRYEPQHAVVAERIAAQIAGAVANLGLREALEREISVSNALAEISRLVNSSPDIRNVFDEVAGRIRDLTGCDRASVSLIDMESGRTVHFMVWGREVDDRPQGWSAPLRGSLAEWLAETRSPLLVNDENFDEFGARFPQLKDQDRAVGINSMLSVPLLVGDMVRGALHLRAAEHNAFNEQHAVLAERIAAQIAGAIVNSEHAAEARRTAEERLALSRIGQLASSSLDFGAVFPDLAAKLSELLPAERVVVAEYDGQSGRFTDRYIWGKKIPGEETGQSYSPAESIAAEALESRSPLAWNVELLRAQASGSPERHARLKKRLNAGLASAMIIPLIWQDRTYGVLSLRSSRDDAYQSRELALARQVGAQIVGAVVVSALYAETRRVADERLGLSEIGQLVSSSLNFGEVFPGFCERLSRLVPADRVVIAEYDWQNEQFVDRHIWGMGVPGERVNSAYPFAVSMAKAVFESKQPKAWSESELEAMARDDPREAARMKAGLNSALSVPLIWQDRVFCVMNVRSKHPNPYGERELALANQAGGQIAGAIAVTELYSETQRVANERLALSEVGRIVSSSLQFGKVFEDLCEKIVKLLPADRIVISTFEEETQSYIDRFIWGVPVPGSHAGRRHAPGQSLSFTLDDAREPTARNKAELEKYIGKIPGVAERFQAGLNSVLRVPLIWQDRIFGELNIRSKLEDPYGPNEIAVAREIGAQIVGAVAVSTLYEEATRTSEERLALSEIGRLVSSSLDFSETYDDLVRQLKRLLTFDRLVLSIFDQSDSSFVDRFVWGEEIPTNPQGGRHKLDEAYVRDAFMQRKSMVRNRTELEELSQISAGAGEGLKRGLVCALSVPMVWQDNVFGMMNLRSKVEDAYGLHEIEVAEQAAAQIAGGFASAFQYEEAVREAEVRRALAAMSLAAGSDHRIDRIFEAIEPELKTIVPYDRISVTLTEPESNKLRLVYVRGIEVPGFEEGDLVNLPPGDGIWKWEATILPNDPVEGGGMERRGLHSWVQVPLGNPSSGPIGYLSLRKQSRNFYSESHKDIMERVATYITPGLQNALAYQREIELARQRERASQLEQQARELERVNQAKSEFFSSVSHELRTPLTSVVAFTDIIGRNRDGTLSDKDLKHLEIVRRNASHLKVLINDLLDASQIESGRMELILRPTDLGKMLRDSADSLLPAFENKRQKLVVSLPRRRVNVEADPDRINQVVSNLLANANKFAPADTKVELTLEVRGSTAVVAVRDHGPGVPEAGRTHLFTPFFRVDDPATRDVEGTGLGLAISKRLMDLHNGTISVEDTPGGGATFVVKLPLMNT